MRTWLVIFRRIVVPSYSLLRNVLYWLIFFWKAPATLKEKKHIKAGLGSLSQVRSLLGRFVWIRDKGGDWTPWVSTIISRGLCDDCDGAAILGIWALKQVGIKARRIGLYNSIDRKKGHAVCLAKDNSVMISNNDLVLLESNWMGSINKFFNFKYDLFLDGWSVKTMGSM